MDIYWESATEEIQERTGDKLLRVEVDKDTGEYVILKYFRSYQGFEEQMRFKFWDPGFVEKVLLEGRPERFNSKAFKYNRAAMRAKAEALQRHRRRDIGRAMGEDLYQASEHGTIYSSEQRTR
jgi:hypothetical protein